MIKVDMDSYLLWSPLFDDKSKFTEDQAALVERYNRAAKEFFELNGIFEQLWRHQTGRALFASPDVSQYIKE